MEFIPSPDRLKLLSMALNGSPTPIPPLSWVRVQKRGPYHGALALVVQSDSNTDKCDVFVQALPRKDLKRKRPGAELTAPPVINKILSKETFALSHLTSFVCATPSDIDPFRRCTHSMVKTALKRIPQSLQIGDRVSVHHGSLAGAEGLVTEVEVDTVAISFAGPESSNDLTADVLISDVSKRFKPGDYVTILYGLHTGVEGFIIEMDGDHATVFQNPKDHVQLGVEASFPSSTDITS